MTEWDELLEQARQVQQRAYSPYSKFRVGAALQGTSGKVYLGCNIENASYRLTTCAEQAAIAVAAAVLFFATTPSQPEGEYRLLGSKDGAEQGNAIVLFSSDATERELRESGRRPSAARRTSAARRRTNTCWRRGRGRGRASRLRSTPPRGRASRNNSCRTGGGDRR